MLQSVKLSLITFALTSLLIGCGGGGTDIGVDPDPVVDSDPVDPNPANPVSVDPIPVDPNPGNASNVALNKEATQSSTDFNRPASRALDGNTDGEFRNASITHTGAGLERWWQVDLGSVEDITNVNLYNRTDCCQERLSDFYLLVSETPFESEGLQDNLDLTGVNSYYFSAAVEDSTSIAVGEAGRYVRIQKVGDTSALSLAEVEVMAVVDPSDPDPIPVDPAPVDPAPVDPADDIEIDVSAVNLVAAKTAYDTSCSACHGPDGQGNVYQININECKFTDCTNVDEMAQYISDEMPPGPQSSDCVLATENSEMSCAAMTSAYIANNFLTGDEAAAEEPGSSTDLVCKAETGVRRSKNILTGLAPTANETSSVIENQNALRGLVAEWIETDEFDTKMMTFFTKSLQQSSTILSDYAVQLNSNPAVFRFQIERPFIDAMNESMARTALWLVENERPFNRIASGRTWMMTTKMMAFLAAAENSGTQDDLWFYHNPVTRDGIRFNANTPPAVQIANKLFYSRLDLPTDFRAFQCDTDPVLYDEKTRDRIFAAFMSDGHSLICGNNIKPEMYTEADGSDWRLVTMVRGEPDKWWDSLAFRGETELKLNTSRTGFFSHPAFLATWRSNEDNDFRVTTNQSLIAGLGRGFEESDASIPLGDEGLADEHAAPGTDCFACHNTLDPMRTYFDVDFDPEFYGAHPDQTPPDYEPSSSFLGSTGAGGDLEDFGRFIAEHPLFAEGWVQKMCAYANAAECDESDPEFQRIVTEFKDSNMNFKTLLIELFSSPLVTGTACGLDIKEEEEIIPTSLVRKDHFCPMLAARSGISNICSINPTIEGMADSLPSDAWSRAEDQANRATDPGMFYRASVERLCSGTSIQIIRSSGSPLVPNDIPGSIDWLVERFMGVSQSDPRYADVRAALQRHADNIEGLGATNEQRLQSIATLACVSPFITSNEF